MRDKILYHYCDNKALESIIKNKQLWMTDISNSNDYNEVMIFTPRLFYKIEEVYFQNPFDIKYFEKTNFDAIKKLLSLINECINRIYDNGYLTSFVTCLCEYGDVLSQWRGYSNDGRGCSIGFSKNELLKYCKKTNGMIRFSKINYVNTKQLDDIIYSKAQIICDVIKKNKDSNESVLFISTYKMIEETLLDSLIYKMDGFREESEWRLYFAQSIKSLDFSDNFDISDNSSYDILQKRYLKKVDFIIKDDIITSYYPLNLMDLSKCPIKRIYIGPKNRVRETDLRMMLAKNEMNDAKVVRSEIAYC